MNKFVRLSGLALLLIITALTLAACGGDTNTAIAPYTGAREFAVDQATQDSFKNALKSAKGATLSTYAVKGDREAVKSYYETQYKDKGWTKEEITPATSSNTSWVLNYKKDTQLVTLLMTPAEVAATSFPGAGGDNVLVVISATK